MKRKFIINLCMSLAIALFTVPALAQNETVKGTVVDENGEPIIGASVRVIDKNGTGTGVITDFDGNYTLSVPKGTKVTISYIGYVTQTVTPGGKVQMKEDAQNLEEVVVVGYGVQKKAHLTGAVASVPMEEIQDLSGAGLASSLSGLVNGLTVSGGDDRVGNSAQMYIRDTNDFGDIRVSAQEPLFVIDGYIYPNDIKIGKDKKNLGAEAFNNLDPSEVESISVLKDASAAVYGARAANGVILVTTKKGKLGAPRISYSGTFGITNAVSTPKMLSAYNYGRLYNAVAAADPTVTSLNHTTGLFQADELEAMKNLNYDLLDKYWDTGFTMQHSVNVSGATEKASYFAGISYYTQDGNLGNLDYDRWNYRAGVDVKISQYLKANLSVSGDYGERNKPNVSFGSSGDENDYRSLLYRPRYLPETVGGRYILGYGVSNAEEEDAKGTQKYSYELMQNQGDYKQNMTSNMNINGSLEYDFGWSKILKGLKLRFSYSKSISTDKGNEYGSEFTLYKMINRTGSGSHLYTPIAGEDYDVYLTDDNFEANTFSNGSMSYLSRNMSRTDNYQINFSASYARTFGKHDISALFSIEKSEAETEWLQGKVADPYSFTTGQSTGAANQTAYAPEWTRYESGTLSYIGRINYAYANKYLLEFLLRSDASTKFAPKNYWGVFPSVSAGWVVSEENWFKKAAPWVDFLKIRASFGLTGRDNTPAWQWMKNYDIWNKTSDGAIFGTSNTATGQILRLNNDNAAINTDVHWDKSYKANLGIDLHVLNQRLGITFETYRVWNREMFMNLSQSVPGTVGGLSAYTNVGEMDNWGYELSLNWRDKIGKDFKYRIGLNTGYSDNKVLNADFATEYIYKAIQKGGRSDIGTWGMQCIGMFRSFQEIQEYVEKYNITQYMGMPVDQIRPGMLIYKDVRGEQQEDGTYAGPNGIVSKDEDQVQLSHRNNPYGFTVNMSAEWKGLSLTAQLNAQWGGYSFVNGQELKPYYGIDATNMPSFWNPDDMFVYQDIYDGSGNLIMKENRNGSLPNLAYASVNSETSNFWRISGTRVTLNRLTLAYKIPTQWIKFIGIQSARVNITGQNLLSFYNPYPDNYIDPMCSYGSYPRLRKWTIGVNLTF